MSDESVSTLTTSTRPRTQRTVTVPSTCRWDDARNALDVARDRVEVERLVDQRRVRRPEDVLPLLLALRQDQLLELAVREQQHGGGRRLEREPALDAEDGVAGVDAPADALRGGAAVQLGDERRAVQSASVECARHASREGHRHSLAARVARVGVRGVRPAVARNRALGTVQVAAADRRAPEAAVDGVGAGLASEVEAALGEVVELLVAGGPPARAPARGRARPAAARRARRRSGSGRCRRRCCRGRPRSLRCARPRGRVPRPARSARRRRTAGSRPRGRSCPRRGSGRNGRRPRRGRRSARAGGRRPRPSARRSPRSRRARSRRCRR